MKALLLALFAVAGIAHADSNCAKPIYPDVDNMQDQDVVTWGIAKGFNVCRAEDMDANGLYDIYVGLTRTKYEVTGSEAAETLRRYIHVGMCDN